MNNASQTGVYDRPTNLDFDARSERRVSLILVAGVAMAGILLITLMF